MHSAELFELMDDHICFNKLPELMALLKKSPQLKNLCDAYGTSLLGRAAYYGNVEVTQWLLEQGVDLWDESHNHRTALQLALVVKQGEVAALLYHYEKQIRANPMESQNNQVYHEIFLKLPDPESEYERWLHEREQIKIFQETTESLSRSGAKLPEATHRIAIDRLNREAGSLSDSSGGSGASGSGSGASAGSKPRHRGGGSGGSSADEDKAPLLAETAFRAAAEGAGTLPDKKPDSMRL